MLPVLLGVLIGRSAGRAVSGGASIYELLAHKNGLRVPPGIGLEDSYYMRAADVMRRILVGKRSGAALKSQMEQGLPFTQARESRTAGTLVRGARGRADTALPEPLDEALRYCPRFVDRDKLRSVLDGELDIVRGIGLAP